MPASRICYKITGIQQILYPVTKKDDQCKVTKKFLKNHLTSKWAVFNPVHSIQYITNSVAGECDLIMSYLNR